jgi:transcriptional regulator with XRE-family HTH domain
MLKKKEADGMNKRIGENIKYFRKEKGLTQKQLGDLSGMADSAIRRYESGTIVPKDENLAKIAHALGVSSFQLKMRGIEQTKEWKEAGAADDYLESIGVDVYYDASYDPDSNELPLVCLQGDNFTVDMEYKDYEKFQERLATYAKHLIERFNRNGE